MKTFDIYENSLTSEVIAIEKGWSWLAFFFTLIYAVFKGNWTFLKFAIIGQIILYFCFKIFTHHSGQLSNVASFLSSFLIGIFGGAKFNEFLANKYIKENFIFKSSIVAPSQEFAISLWLREHNKNN